MGTIFTLTDDIKAITSAAISDLITELGKTCTLVYPPVWTPCVNCVSGPGNAPPNRWVTGGPVPFPDGSLCPVCDGAGQRADEVTDTVKMLVANHPSKFFLKMPAGISVPDGVIQTKGFLTDLPKVLQAREIILQPGQFPIRLRYVMDGEPLDVSNIVQATFFVAFWKRVGG